MGFKFHRNRERTVKHPSLYKVMLLGLLMPMLTTVSVTIADSVSHPTVVLADKDKNSSKKDESKNSKDDDDDSSKDSSDSSSESSSGQQADSDTASPWNSALSTLGQSAAAEDDDKQDAAAGKNGDHGKDDQANIDTVAVNGNKLNVWGFMGKDNTDVWEKANNSSWSVSYDSLVEATDSAHGGKNMQQKINRANAYKQAGRFAYVMQASGLDQPVKDGLTGKVPLMFKAGGTVMQISYAVMTAMEKIFHACLQLLSNINPIGWALGRVTPAGPMAPLATVVHDLYQGQGGMGGFKGFGLALCGVILACSLAMAGLGITVGSNGNHVGQVRALINTFVNLLKRFFIWIMLPVFGFYFFGAVVNSADDLFDTEQTSVPNYAVFGSMVDYNDWVMRSRLALPSGVKLQASFSDRNLPALQHGDILAINQRGAGITGLSKLSNNTRDNIGLALENTPNSDLNKRANSMLEDWRKGSSISAADYASAMDPQVSRNAQKDKGNGGSSSSSSSSKDSKNSSSTDGSDLSSELVKTKYNNDAGNQASGNSANSVIYGNANAQPGSISTAGNASGAGLSTLGTYAYLLTTAQDDRMTIGYTEKMSSDVALPEHRSTVLVGTGIEQTGNFVWAFGMMVGLAFLSIGYLVEVLKTIIQSIPAITAAVLETGLMSIRGGVKFISVLFGLAIGVFGSAAMYLVANKAYISVAQMSDMLLTKNMFQSALTTFFSAGQSGVVGLDSVVSGQVANGAFNLFEGIFLLWTAYLLYRYRGVVVAYAASVVEETANKIMATFGNISGQGSAGTRGMVLQNTNSGSMLAGVGAGAARGAGLLAVAGGGSSMLKSLANGSGKGTGKSDKKGADQKHNGEKNNTRTSQLGKHSSANQQGNAAQRTDTARNNDRANQNQNTRDSNMASREARNADNNNLQRSANNSGIQRLSSRTGADRMSAGQSNNRLSNAQRNGERSNNLQSGNRVGAVAAGGMVQPLGYQNDQNTLRDSNQIGGQNQFSDAVQNRDAEMGYASPNENGVGQNGMDSSQMMAGNDSSQLMNNDSMANDSQFASDNGFSNDSSPLTGNDAINAEDNQLANDAAGDTMPGADSDNADALQNQDQAMDGINGVGNNGDSFAQELQDSNNQQQQMLNQLGGDNSLQNNAGSQNAMNRNGDARHGGMQLGNQHSNNQLGGQNLHNGDLMQNAANSQLAGDQSNSSQFGGQNSRNGDLMQNAANNHQLGGNSNMNQQGNTSQLGNQNVNSQLGGQNLRNGDLMQNAANNQLGGNNSMSQHAGIQNASVNNGGMHLGQTNQGALQNNAANSTLGATNSQFGTNVGGNTALGNSSTANTSIAGATNNRLNSVPVNNAVNANTVQSQMGNLQQAHQTAVNANKLAEANPGNQTLAQNAQAANSNLQQLQSNALRDYSQQSIGSNTPQASWMSQNANLNQMSVGTANSAMDNVYQAQQNLASAQQNFGSGSKQVQQATSQLQAARQSAVSAGLDSNIVNNAQAVSSAHQTIADNASSLMNGTWSPQMNGGSAGSVSHLDESSSRSIGL